MFLAYMKGSVRVDYLVIGAGIAGASLAYELAAHGSVLVVERETVAGYHSTGRSAATFNHSYGQVGLRALAQASTAFYESPPKGFAEYPLLAARGALLIAQRDRAELLERGDIADEVQRLSPAEVCALVPALREEWLAGGRFDPTSRDIDVNAVHQGYLRGAKVVTDACVTAIRAHTEWRVTTTKGEYAARVVVNAAGAWGDEIQRLAGLPALGLQAKKRSAFLFAAPEHARHWPMVIDLDERFYFKPEGDRLLASPANQEAVAPHDVSPDELDIALGVERLQQCSTLAVHHIARKWAGLRTFAPDHALVSRFCAPGFYCFLGQGGSGIKIAPAAARQAVERIVSG